MSIDWSIQGGILTIVIDNSPVNAISQIERQGLIDAMIAATDASVQAVILTGAANRFVAGADISEFGKEALPPHLPSVVEAIEQCRKPVIAVIAGLALGGGLELALACHYRVASSQAKLGLPEVTLGIIPGAGGTQRLPRLVGPIIAAEMISNGKVVSAATARDQGLVDIVANEDDLMTVATGLALSLLGGFPEDRRLSARVIAPDPQILAELDRLSLVTAKRARGANAPMAAIELVRASMELPYAAGMEKERETFLSLRSSQQARALRHIFFAEKAAAKPKDALAVPRSVQRVGIIGAGTMGSGIAMTFADTGIPVTIIETTKAALGAGLERVATGYQNLANRNKITSDEAQKRSELVVGSTDYGALAKCDLIIEAAFEAIDVKRTIFRELDRVAKPGAVLATNTSYLDLNEIAAVTDRPQDVVGMHYFSPAHVMKLLEIVRGERTSPDVIATALGIARRTAKVAVVANVCNGFIGNRMFRAYNREAGLLLLEGAGPQSIDDALTKFGMAMGPFAVADLSGIDIGYKARQAMAPGSYEPLATIIHDSLVEEGYLGRKADAGFYAYDAQGKAVGLNPAVDRLVSLAQQQTSIDPRQISDDEIVERCLYALINEGGYILDENIAERASDIDVVYVNGYGFPRHLGGPMFFAQQQGLEIVKSSVLKLQSGRFGKWWEPSPFLG